MNSSEIIMFLFCCLITLGAYGISRVMMVRFPSPLTTPVFFSTVIVILIMLPLHITLEDYQPASDVMTFLLGPATVALAVPLYKNRFIIQKYWRSVGLGLIIGLLSTIVSAVLILKLFQVPEAFLVAMSAKSVTVPIALEIIAPFNGSEPLTIAFIVFTGTMGGVLGPWLMTKFHIHNPIARGLSLGTIAHGQGTAIATMEGELQGAIAGAAMGVTAVLTSFLAPALIPILLL